MPDDVYNPLDRINLGKSVAEAALDRAPASLGEIEQFEGVGIYLIYYAGDCAPYRLMSARNAEKPVWPIYIGKAVPSGARKGMSASTGRQLWNRLREHADSIRASDLDIDNFQCRYLIVDDIWIPLAESLLIARFKPVWNLVLDGFGNHDPGSGRYTGLRPLWDVLHPGRAWAEKCAARTETAEELARRIEEHLSQNPPPADPRMDFASHSPE